MEKVKKIVEQAVSELDDVLSEEQTKEVARVIESAALQGILEGQHRAIDACKNVSEAELDIAHKIALEIKKKNDALIANLSSLR